MFSCKTRGFCPSCHAKRREEWGEWMREELLLDVPPKPNSYIITLRYRELLSCSRCYPRPVLEHESHCI
jgi:hypothetical protein